ncbi:MAG: DUF1559 domain-containing protein [Gemmataceae bacterium]|nr:DUF1559 domain-containing protein [Gemmataceae bacterium]
MAWSPYDPFYDPSFTTADQQKSLGVKVSQISDGLSHTLLFGEKHIPLTKLAVGWWDCSTLNGNHYTCNLRAAGLYFTFARDYNDREWKFGSYHYGITPFVMCDGSVRKYSVDLPELLQERLAKRDDGEMNE